MNSFKVQEFLRPKRQCFSLQLPQAPLHCTTIYYFKPCFENLNQNTYYNYNFFGTNIETPLHTTKSLFTNDLSKVEQLRPFEIFTR